VINIGDGRTDEQTAGYWLYVNLPEAAVGGGGGGGGEKKEDKKEMKRRKWV